MIDVNLHGILMNSCVSPRMRRSTRRPSLERNYLSMRSGWEGGIPHLSNRYIREKGT